MQNKDKPTKEEREKAMDELYAKFIALVLSWDDADSEKEEADPKTPDKPIKE